MALTEIGIDLDGPSSFDIVRVWYTLKRYDHIDRLEGRLSSSKEGVHIRVWTWDIDGIDAARFEREKIGDHDKRIEYDENANLKPPDILFTEKKGKRSGEWLDSLGELVEAYRRENGWFA